MKSIKEIYPNLKENKYFYGPYDYDPLLKSFNYEILLQIDDDDYSWHQKEIERFINESKILLKE